MARRGARRAGGWRWTAAVAALGVLTLVGCGSPADRPGGGDPVAEIPGLGTDRGDAAAPDPHSGEAVELPPLPEKFTEQTPRWEECAAPTPAQGSGAAPGDPWRCATLRVPVDYAEPDGDTLDLALIRATATGGSRIGSLVFNFGGPGASGVAMLPRSADRFAELREGYDLVSFDPRGVGESAGVVCRTDQERDADLAALRYPRTDRERRDFLADRRTYAESCAEQAGALLPRLTTSDAARDVEVLRGVLGDSRLHYYGASYGTKLGAVYAGLFPERVGRMVLDAAVDPTVDVVDRALGQAAGFQLALDNYLAACADQPDCPVEWDGEGPAGHAYLTGVLDSLAESPLPAGDGRLLTQSLAVTGVVGSLYSTAGWSRLSAALREIAEEGRGERLLAAADRYNGRDSQGRYRNLLYANNAINCADFASRPDLDTVAEQTPRFAEASPVLGRWLVWGLLDCAGWPSRSAQDQPEVLAEGAPPILLLGVTGDPATPYRGAEAMRGALGDGVGVLLTLDGEGHGAYTSGNSCVITAVNAHLLAGNTPEDGTVCS